MPLTFPNKAHIPSSSTWKDNSRRRRGKGNSKNIRSPPVPPRGATEEEAMGFRRRPRLSAAPPLLQKIVAVMLLFYLLLLVASAKQFGTAAPGRARRLQRSPADVPVVRLAGFDSYFSSKRRVPNTWDPLHNR